MTDLTREMAELVSALGRPAGGRSRALMFVSALSGEGVSTVAREYARCEAAFAVKPVWLIDADLRDQTQMHTLTQEPARFGPPGALSQASPDGSAFFTLSPPARDGQGRPVGDDRFLVAQPFLDKRLWVTRFCTEKLAPGQRVKMFEQTGYWAALRSHAGTIVVDAPAADRSVHALQLAGLMDGVVMVVSEGDGDVQSRLMLKADLEQAGGKVLGIVYNRARPRSSWAPPWTAGRARAS